MIDTTLTINTKKHPVKAPENVPLLWVIRDIIGLTGTKFGCGVSQCGACSVLLDNTLVKSCSITLQDAVGKQITTIEGHTKNLELLKKTWQTANVPQCGYCQPGQLIAATSLLNNFKNPTDKDIENVMSNNICRCGTYTRIKKAIHAAIAEKNESI